MTTTDLAIPDSPIASALALVEPAYALVERVCRTNFVPQAYRGKPDEALACVMLGEELDLKPMTALREIAMIQGTPALSAKLQRALVTRAGHEVWLVESSNVKCVMAGRRADWPKDRVTHVTWTIQDAEAAKLASKDNWRNHPTDMLIARASGRLCRLLASEVMLGLAYNVEELRDGYTEDPDEGSGLEVDEGAPPPPAPKGRTRKLAPKRDREKVESSATPEPASAPAPAADPLAEVDDLDAMAEGKPVPKGPPPPIAPDRPAAEGEGARFTPAQALAMRAGEAGLKDETSRHLFYFAATSTSERPAGYRSGKDMPAGVVSSLMEWLGSAIEAGEPVRVEVEADGAVSVMLADEEAFFAVDPSLAVKEPDPPAAVPDAPADDPSVGWADTDWQARFRARGGWAQVLRWLTAKAAELGVEPVPSTRKQVQEMPAGALRSALVAWLTEAES